MNGSKFQFIIKRLVDNANDAFIDYKNNINDEFYIGKKLAYYEVLDTIKMS